MNGKETEGKCYAVPGIPMSHRSETKPSTCFGVNVADADGLIPAR